MREKEFKEIAHVVHEIGRSVESYMIKYLLKETDGNAVIKELSHFQNKDGGFAHGLEPDCWNTLSSPLQTQFAMGYLRLIEFNPNHKVIKKMMKYLEKSYDQHIRKWHLLLESNNHYPHAPWWTYRLIEEDYNPSASIAGFIIKYGKPKSKVFKYALEVAHDVINDLNDGKIFTEPHEISNIIDLFDDASLYFNLDENFQNAKNKLIPMIGEVIEKDQKAWFKSYVTKPSVLIHSNKSIGYEAYHDLLNLEFEEAMKHRNDLHIWPVTWSWSDYLDVFEETKEIWSSIIALKYLYLMKDNIKE